MDQRLRLQAEVRDNASPKLKAIGKELKEIRRTPGMEQAQKWFSGFNETAEGFVKSGGGVAGVMGSIGIGGLTAAASLAGLVVQLKELGDHTFALKKLGQETGLTIDQIRKWEYVGQVFRVPVDEMDAALKTLGDQMVDFKQRRGELFGQLNQVDPKLSEKLQLEDTQHQLQDILGWLSRIPDAAKRNRWAKEFFGTENIDSLLTNGLPALQQALENANKNIKPLDPGFQAKADLLNQSVIDFNTAWQNFEVNIGPTVFTELKQAADDFTDVFNQIKAVWEFIQAEKNKPVGEIVGDVAGVAKDAAVAKGAEIEQRYKDRAAAVRAGEGEDGNALHRNDETTFPSRPASTPTAAPPRAEERSWFGSLFHRSSFVTGLDGGDGGSGSDDGISGAVKEGTLAAFREWAAQSDVTKAAGGGEGGLTNASYTTFGDGTGGGGASSSAARLRGMGRGGRGGGGGGSYADTPDGPAKDVPGAMQARGLEAMKYLVEKKGWTPEGAAIAVGNAQQESSIRADGKAGDGGISQHMFQWNHERLAALNRFAAERGKAATDFQTNLDFLDEERKHRSGLERQWDKQHDLRNAGRLSHLYEGFGDNSGATREQNARNWLKAYKDLPNLSDEARKAATPPPGTSDGSIEAHVHIHDGQVRGATARSSGIVKPPRVNLRRGPTMTEPSIQA